MNILGGWDISLFKSDIFTGMLKVQTHFCTTKGSQNIRGTILDIRFQDTGLSYIQDFLNLISHFDLLISWLRYIIKKGFCTPDGAMDLTFQMKYVPAF